MARKVACAHCGHEDISRNMRKNPDSVYFQGKWTCRNIPQCIERKYKRDRAAGVC